MKVKYTRQVSEGFGGAHRETKVEEVEGSTLPDRPEGVLSVELAEDAAEVHDWKDE